MKSLPQIAQSGTSFRSLGRSLLATMSEMLTDSRRTATRISQHSSAPEVRQLPQAEEISICRLWQPGGRALAFHFLRKPPSTRCPDSILSKSGVPGEARGTFPPLRIAYSRELVARPDALRNEPLEVRSSACPCPNNRDREFQSGTSGGVRLFFEPEPPAF